MHCYPSLANHKYQQRLACSHRSKTVCAKQSKSTSNTSMVVAENIYAHTTSCHRVPILLLDRRRFGLLLRRANMRVVHLCRELETRDGLLEMGLQRADHDEHERLGVAAEGVLEEVCQLLMLAVKSTCVTRVCANVPSSSCKGYALPPWTSPAR